MMEKTQEDREAAARIYGAFRDYHNAKAAEDGHLDDGCVVQAFAQHRTTALAAKDEELAAVKAERDAAVALLREIDTHWRIRQSDNYLWRLDCFLAALPEQQP